MGPGQSAGAVIEKNVRAARLTPNLADYDRGRRAFSWEAARLGIDGLPGGRGLNIAYEAVDRHVAHGHGDRVAIRWLSRSGERHDISYAALAASSARFANVAEAGVIGIPDPVAGEIVKAHVTLKPGVEPSHSLRRELIGFARTRLGPAVAPRAIAFDDSLPHTRSGKIMRRLVRARELGLPEGDTSTLEPSA